MLNRFYKCWGRAISLPSLLWKVYFEQKEQNCCKAYDDLRTRTLNTSLFRTKSFSQRDVKSSCYVIKNTTEALKHAASGLEFQLEIRNKAEQTVKLDDVHAAEI